MKMKKFEAPSMQEALAKIKEEMGADAFILSTKQITKKGPLGFGDRKFLQVTAAIEEDDAPATPPPPKASAPARLPASSAKEESWTSLLSETEDSPAMPSYNYSGQKQEPIQIKEKPSFTEGFEAVFADARTKPIPKNILTKPSSASEKEGGRLRAELSELKTMVQNLDAREPDLSPLQQELRELKGLLYNVIRGQSPIMGRSLTPTMLSQYQKLRDSGMDDTLAARIISIADDRLKGDDRDNPRQVRRYITGIIRQSVEVRDPAKARKRGAQIMALVGPTGVGKTTTLAKLAAFSALQEQAKVVLITLDTYRIAAVEQLKTYAKIMEIPVQVALNTNELRQAIQFHQDKSLILIDTAGHSQRDTAGMENLRNFLSNQDDIEIHLVLSATTKASDLNDIVEKFEPLMPQYLIFTKLDETSGYGPLLSQIVKTKKAVSYVTTGQNVPEDFEFATKDLLAGIFSGQTLDQIKGQAK